MEKRDETHVEQHGDGDVVVNPSEPAEQPEQQPEQPAPDDGGDEE